MVGMKVPFPQPDGIKPRFVGKFDLIEQVLMTRCG
jgi:hypothetical protein